MMGAARAASSQRATRGVYEAGNRPTVDPRTPGVDHFLINKSYSAGSPPRISAAC